MSAALSKTERVISWSCRIIAAAILTQTLFFKFSGAKESVHIFTQLGVEPWGRIATGLAELAAVVLLLTPRFVWAGALISFSVMSGALASHLTVLGIVVENDGGLLFGMAITVLLCSVVTVYLHRREIPHQCRSCQIEKT